MPDYLVKTIIAENDEKSTTTMRERLVRAKNEARAIAHVVADTVSIDRASTDDVIRLTKEGVTMEQAA